MTEIIVLLVVAAVAYVAFKASRQPDEFKVARNALIDAPPAAVFPYVNDLQKWQEWSPWAKMDPDAKAKFEGPSAGKGAKFHWEGRKTGQGNMTITESRPDELVRFHLEFLKPMKGTSDGEFILEAQDGKTRVTWIMTGRNNLFGKILSVFKDCEKMAGEQFEQGFENLRGVVTNPPGAQAA